MIELVYASAARQLHSPYDLGKLLEVARRNNARLGVSGILLYEHGSFLQVLEGDEAVVDALFERISSDARHHRITVLQRRPIEARSFSHWTMGFVSLDADLRRVLPESHSLRSNGSLQGPAPQLVELLDTFRDGRWHPYILG